MVLPTANGYSEVRQSILGWVKSPFVTPMISFKILKVERMFGRFGKFYCFGRFV